MNRVCRLAGLVLLCIASGLAQAEPVSEPQFLLYYQASFDGGRKSTTPIFGMRLDRVATDSDARPGFDQLLRRPGFAELRMNGNGVKSFTLAGLHYDSSPVVAHADEEANAGTPEAGAPEAAEQGEGEPEQQAQETGAGTEGEKSLDDYIKEIPFGYFIGAGLAIVIFSGVAG